MPTKFQNIDPMTALSTRTNILTVIKAFALDMDTVACNEFNIVPSKGFLIYPILPDPPTLPAYKLHHESIIQQNLFRRNQSAQNTSPIRQSFWPTDYQLVEILRVSHKEQTFLKVQGRRMNRTLNDRHRCNTCGNSIAIHWNHGRPRNWPMRKCFQVLKLTRQEALHSTGLEQIWFGSFSSQICSSKREDIQFCNRPP